MSTISYPKTWVSGEILTAADLNAQFAAVNTITALSTGQIANQAITVAQLADAAVETAKIKDANVTLAKMATGSVSTAKLIDGATVLQTLNVTATGVTPIGANTTLISQPFTITRTHVRFVMSWNGFLVSAAPVSNVITVEFLRGVTVLATVTSRITNLPSGQAVPVSGCIPYFDSVVAGAYTYLLRMSITGGSQTTTINAQMMIEEVV